MFFLFTPLVSTKGVLFGGIESFTILAETKQKNMKYTDKAHKLLSTIAISLLSILILLGICKRILNIF